MELPALVTLVALLEYMFFSYSVGMGRGKYDVPAPAVSGNETWERLYRVQMNTLEQIVVFVPALWLFAWYLSPLYGALIGLGFIVGRPIYYMSYVSEPSKRTVGFLLGFLATTILLLGGIGGVLYKLVS